MGKICGIYKITNPNGRIYIGQSTNCGMRKSKYKNVKCTDQPKIYKSILKYGWDAHKFEIIHQCTPEELNDLEVYYIELFQCFNTGHGLNLQNGGKRCNHSIETREKIRKSLIGHKRTLGKKMSEKNKEDLRIRMRGNKYALGLTPSKETLIKRSESLKKVIHTKEWGDKISISNKGRIFSEEHKKRIGESSKGRKSFLGRKHTLESKLKMSLTKERRRKEIELERNSMVF